MESAFLRMRDVPSSVILCSSRILMLPGIYCINSSNPFLISPRALITPGIVVAFIPHILSTLISRCLYFEFFSYFNGSVRFSGDGHINKQAAFFLFVLDYSVWSVSLYHTNCIGISHKIVMLSFSVTV